MRFEPALRGHAIDSRVTRIDAAGAVTPFDLNSGIDYGTLPNPGAQAIAGQLRSHLMSGLRSAGDVTYHPQYVADMLGLAHIRALEVATFYFMFQLQPVGAVAHLQICGTLSCMICGAEDLVAVCREKIAPKAHQLSADGRFSWEEVECLGACANVAQAEIPIRPPILDSVDTVNADPLLRLS